MITVNTKDFSCQYAVIGAGPYGLAVASHLRAAGVDVRVFGKVMDFWENHMPKGMWLRSPRHGSDIAAPRRALTLDRYEADRGTTLTKPIPLEDFVSYGKWFQRQALPDLDERLVTRVTPDEGGFSLTMQDGETLSAHRVVIASGIGPFAHYPSEFGLLSRELVSHTSDRANRDLGRFSGRRVVVVGAGQSAIESAALLDEAGAEVEVLVRQPRLRWLKGPNLAEWLYDHVSPFQAPGKIGPLGLNWLIEHPHLFTLLPRRWQDRLAERAIRPAASSWLRPRTTGVALRTGRHVVAAGAHRNRVRLTLNDGSLCEADHVLLGTGYKISIARYGFLAPELIQHVRTVNGYPLLNRAFESSLPGLYFVGATAAYSFGPLCRFVVGSKFAACTLAGAAVRSPAPRRRLALAH